MFQCTECQVPIKEIDAAFYKNYYGQNQFSSTTCKCVRCAVGRDLFEIIDEHYEFKRFSCLLWLTPLLILTAGIAGLFLFLLEEVGVSFGSFLLEEILYGIGIGCVVLSAYTAIGFWIAGAYNTLKRFNFRAGYASSSTHLETSYNSSSNTFVTKSVSDYYVSGDGGKAFGLGISFPFWSIPYLIYRNRKFSKLVPEIIRNAYDATRQQVSSIHVSEFSQKKFTRYDEKWDKYCSERKRIEKTYSTVGVNEVNKRMNSLKKPRKTVIKLNKTKYVVLDRRGSYLHLKAVKNNREKILIGDYFLYADHDGRKNMEKEWQML